MVKHYRERKKRLSGRRIAAILVGAALVYAGVLLGVHAIGDRLEKKDAKEPTGSLDGRFASDAPTLEYAGRTWTYRERDLTNLLLIGIDWDDTEPEASERYSGQSDFLVLLTIDKKNKTVTTLQLDRDTITDVRVYALFGDYTGVQQMQLCLSHAYGKDQQENCENTVWAVSNLLAGVPVDGYLTLDMSSIAILNDALGGVTVTLEEDFSALDPEMTKGATLTLHGQQAEHFVRGRRNVGDGTNAARMKRQQAFIRGAEELLVQGMSEDLDFIDKLYDTLGDHMVTSFRRGWLVNTAYKSKDYQRKDTLTPAGSHIVGADGFMEFHVDQEALSEMLTELFFE